MVGLEDFYKCEYCGQDVREFNKACKTSHRTGGFVIQYTSLETGLDRWLWVAWLRDVQKWVNVILNKPQLQTYKQTFQVSGGQLVPIDPKEIEKLIEQYKKVKTVDYEKENTKLKPYGVL
jgi:hypothetical protein